MTDHTYINPADVKVGQRVQVEDHRQPIVGYWETVVYTSPEGTVDIIRDEEFHVTYPGQSTAWYRQDDKRLRVRLIKDVEQDLAPGIYDVYGGYLKWNGERWIDADGEDFGALGNWKVRQAIRLDSQIVIERPNFSADRLRAWAKSPGFPLGAILDSIADALEEENNL